MRVFFIVLARDASGTRKKAEELERLGCPYIIVCGERTDQPNVIFREPRGKYDAINFAVRYIPPDTEIVAFNDVDTEIHNFDSALDLIQNEDNSLVFVKVKVGKGPQVTFYSFLDALRKKIPIAASGELMLIRIEDLRTIIPLKGCKAEDTYLLFKILENGRKIAFSEDCYVTTRRTSHAEEEEVYKRRTVGGIYQALSTTRPPIFVKLFYTILPFMTPLLLILGKKGYYWTKGILSGYVDYVRGDKTSSWKPTY